MAKAWPIAGATATPSKRFDLMEIIGTCINCWPASASLTVNVVCAIAMLGFAVCACAA